LVKKEYSLLFLLKYIKGLKRRLINLIKEIVVSNFGVKELVLNIFHPFNIYRLVLTGINRGDSVVDGGLQQISLISFFRDSTIL